MKPVLYLWGQPEQFPNYLRAITDCGGQLCFDGPPDACDGLLLPGGGDLDPKYYGQPDLGSHPPDAVRDRKELDLLEYFVSRNRPVLGICRGLQVINVFFGGTLTQDLPGHNAVNGIDRLHKITSLPSPFREVCETHSIVNSAHHQAIAQLGRDLQPAQYAPDGTIEAMFHKTFPIWAVQWHPERLTGPFRLPGTADGSLLLHAFLSLCTAEKRKNFCK